MSFRIKVIARLLGFVLLLLAFLVAHAAAAEASETTKALFAFWSGALLLTGLLLLVPKLV